MSESALLLKESWQTLRSRVDSRMEEYLSLGADCPDDLLESMKYSLLGGGKRLRPLLVMLACDACGGNLEIALPAACAVEMVHTYSLIHDDLPAMDDDALRRGRPTAHVKFGESTAILAGDALLTLAFEVLVREVSPADVAAACCADLASGAGAVGMVAGQVADLQAQDSGEATLEELEAIHRRKTGRLMCAAVTMGARIAGADSDTLQSLTHYGKCVGLAFQIADDLLDVNGEEIRMGKGVRKDADLGKLTYPALLGKKESRRRAEELIDDACRSIAALEQRGQRLEALAHFVLARDH